MIVRVLTFNYQKLFEHGASMRDIREDIEANKDNISSEIMMVIKRFKMLELKLIFVKPSQRILIHKTEGLKVGDECRIAILKYQKNQQRFKKDEKFANK